MIRDTVTANTHYFKPRLSRPTYNMRRTLIWVFLTGVQR